MEEMITEQLVYEVPILVDVGSYTELTEGFSGFLTDFQDGYFF